MTTHVLSNLIILNVNVEINSIFLNFPHHNNLFYLFVLYFIVF